MVRVGSIVCHSCMQYTVIPTVLVQVLEVYVIIICIKEEREREVTVAINAFQC